MASPVGQKRWETVIAVKLGSLLVVGASYRFQESQPYLYFESESLVGTALVIKTYKDPTGQITKHALTDYDDKPVKAKVLLPKASLYNSPKEESKTKSYLIKGDQVTLLNFSGADWKWVLVEVSGANKWMHTDELSSLNPATELPGSFRNLTTLK